MVPAPLGSGTLDGLPEGAVFTLTETADILKIPKTTMRQMVQSQQIMSIRLGNKTRIPRRSLLACLRGVSHEELNGLLPERARE
jgi:excisionase family DNA binding protein